MSTSRDEAFEADWAAAAEARLLAATLVLAPTTGWTWRTAYAAGREIGLARGDVELLTPEGPRDLAALWSRSCDAAALAALPDPAGLKVRERIRAAVAARLEAAAVHQAATRRWAGFLARPANAPLALRLAWESADRIWTWAGDRALDANHYSKRALLAEMLAGALLVRLAQGADAAEGHVERRIAAVMAFERFKGRVGRLGLGRRAAGLVGRLRYGGL